MSSRGQHRRRLLVDRDVIHVGLVSLLACAATAGGVYAWYWWRVWRTAARAPVAPVRADCLLVFGKHAPSGALDADFRQRLARAAELLTHGNLPKAFLLGGGPSGVPTEAEVARNALLAHGVADAALHLEGDSRDTLQNLRNARDLLRAQSHLRPVALLSSRYHLARCLQFARQLGLEAEACAAEARLRWSPTTVMRISGEAAYLCIADLGTRWARAIGARRMLARVT